MLSYPRNLFFSALIYIKYILTALYQPLHDTRWLSNYEEFNHHPPVAVNVWLWVTLSRSCPRPRNRDIISCLLPWAPFVFPVLGAPFSSSSLYPLILTANNSGSLSLSLSHTNSLIESNWIDLLLLSKEFICTNKAYQSLLETQPEAHVRPFLLRHQWNGQNVLKSLSAVNPSLITMYAFNMNNMHKTLFACRISKAEQHCHCSPWRCLVVLLFHSPHTVIQ
jgi:hypothetical protein